MRRFGRQSSQRPGPWHRAAVAQGVAMGGQPRSGYALQDSQRAPGSARNERRLHPAAALPGRVRLAPAGLGPRAAALLRLGSGRAWPQSPGGAAASSGVPVPPALPCALVRRPLPGRAATRPSVTHPSPHPNPGIAFHHVSLG